MIKAVDLYKSFGDVHVLKGLCLTVNDKEYVGIVGGSGVGKSTLMHILGTLESFEKGSITIDGQDIGKLKKKELAKFRNQRIGFVFQFHHLLPEFTALENVMIPGLISKAEKNQIEKRAKELLDYLKLGHRLHHKPGQLSGGEQQRVAVARAMINQPSILLADEPTGNLDKVLAEELHELLLNMRDDFDQTIVIVTHDMDLAQRCDRTIRLEDGKIVGQL